MRRYGDGAEYSPEKVAALTAGRLAALPPERHLEVLERALSTAYVAAACRFVTDPELAEDAERLVNAHRARWDGSPC